MTNMTTAAGVLAVLMVAGFSPAATLYGSYQFSATHTCHDPACTTATDVTVGSGSNNLQGPSELLVTATENSLGQMTGTFTISSVAGSVSGNLNASFDPTVAPPAFGLSGTADFTSGTGPYADFMADADIVGAGFFTSPTTGAGTLTFAPEPQTWALAALAFLTLAAFRRNAAGIWFRRLFAAANAVGKLSLGKTSCYVCIGLLILPAVRLVAQSGQPNPDIEPWVGTWKANIAKSKFTAGRPDQTLAITIAPDGTFTAEGVSSEGKPIHWSHALGNGETVPVEGMAAGVTDVSVIHGRTLDDTMTLNGKVIAKVHAVLSADGTTNRATGYAIDPQQGRREFVELFEKQ